LISRFPFNIYRASGNVYSLERRYFFGVARRGGARGARGHILSPPPLCPRVPCSPVAHHHGVGRGRGDVLTVTPLLTAPLGLEPDSLADQLTLTGATRANGLERETSGEEFCFGCCGEVHGLLCAVCIVQGQGRSVKRSVKQERGDRFDARLVCSHRDPCHGVALVGAAPDHGVLAKGSGEAVGMVDIGCPVTTPLIEGTEGSGLNCPVCCQHEVVVCVVCIVDPRGQHSAPLLHWFTVRSASRPVRRC